VPCTGHFAAIKAVRKSVRIRRIRFIRDGLCVLENRFASAAYTITDDTDPTDLHGYHIFMERDKDGC
jgi:hypothetical protein